MYIHTMYNIVAPSLCRTYTYYVMRLAHIHSMYILYVLQRLGATMSMYESLIFPRPGATIYMYEPHFLAKKKRLSEELSLFWNISPLQSRLEKKKRLLKTKRGGGKRKESSLCFGISPIYINRGSQKKKGPLKTKRGGFEIHEKRSESERKSHKKKNRGLQGLLNEREEVRKRNKKEKEIKKERRCSLNK